MKKHSTIFLCLALAAGSTGCGNKNKRPSPLPAPTAAVPQAAPANTMPPPEPIRTVAPEVIAPSATPPVLDTTPKPPLQPIAMPPVSVMAEPAAPFTGIVAAHNAERAKVGVAPLAWSAEVAAYAQEWADSLKTQNCAMQHRSEHRYGENLAWGGGLTPDRVVSMWSAESAHYHYASNACQAGQTCGHYTQVVWRTSNQLGCGMARCANGSDIWVCNYNPPGNYIGQKPY